MACVGQSRGGDLERDTVEGQGLGVVGAITN